MNNITRWGTGLAAAVAALGLMAAAAQAQTATQAPAKPAANAPAAAPAAAPTAAKKAKKPPSECTKLDEATCKSKSTCRWATPKKPNAKTGKIAAPHCVKLAGAAAASAAKKAGAQTGMSGMSGMDGMSGMAAPKKKSKPATAPAGTMQ